MDAVQAPRNIHTSGVYSLTARLPNTHCLRALSVSAACLRIEAELFRVNRCVRKPAANSDVEPPRF